MNHTNINALNEKDVEFNVIEIMFYEIIAMHSENVMQLD